VLTVYCTGQYFLFLVIGKGWTITRPTLTSTEWFLALLVAVLFLFTSFTFAGYATIAPKPNWIIYTCILYSYVFAQFLGLIWVEMQALKGQLIKFDARMPEERTAPIKLKLAMFSQLFIVGIAVSVLELLCQIMFASKTVSVLAICAVYEIGSWLIMLYVAIIFHPRKWSLFFFMVPTTQLHREQLMNDLSR
jgi:hypothetical protein